MLSALYPDVNWPSVETVGFDMDGTLYDEYNFIEQTYRNIANKCVPGLSEEARGDALNFMLCRWLEKGSSYPKIFSETAEQFQIENPVEFESTALDLFRSQDPHLEIDPRVGQILRFISSQYQIFLVTDGNFELQKRKFKALQISSYIPAANVLFTSRHALSKGDKRIVEHLPVASDAGKTVFFGDRDVDRTFAVNCGFEFVYVKNMVAIQ